ncbi:MAG: UTP--glucose-1-phosphate uridylyltransferase [Pirellulales bacterium]|nr:UTP--glucose-1-phosphate uridylyltransferase [Pirellulales bacterium]
MQISKAVITAAGHGQRRLPLQRFVDLDGVEKTALEIIIEEVLSAGVEQICLVVRPGDQAAYAEAAGTFARMLVFVEQPEPRGYGDALYRAAGFVGNEAFIHLVSDHLYISHASQRCAQQLVETAKAERSPVSAVQATRESMLPYYGTIGGRRRAGRTDLYEIDHVVEKPTPTEAEQSLLVPGLRAGHYLCLFGMHVLTPTIFELLDPPAHADASGPVMLSPALAALARRENYLALELNGSRYNIGIKYGILMAQLALALSGADREDILDRLVEMLASRRSAV